eukprot:TRINITY_DN14333_c0_g1_i1.p1 TRINITY_DN14333_c0_g1~~TRINITY_DN14333_c0_g1_i1.p1  ORF type:complete len:373 (+),score=78.65 TRINITY_DN14333_c0_g1_i1:117-1235(+)
MALLRRGSSKISEENFRGRLEREHAKTGAITASLAWNDPSDLDLHCKIHLASGGTANIYYSNKRAGGGVLDVDMHENNTKLVDEPVENIHWMKPPAGDYSVSVHMYKHRGSRQTVVPFKAILKREDEDDLFVEGAVSVSDDTRSVECFRFAVGGDGTVEMKSVGTPMPEPTPVPSPSVSGSAMKAMKDASFGAAAVKIRAKTALAIKNAKAKEKSALAKLIAKQKAQAKSAKVKAHARVLASKVKMKAKATAASKKTAAAAASEKKAAAAKAAPTKITAMKAKLSKKDKAKRDKALVFHGSKDKTKSGLTKGDLVKNKDKKIVSRKKSEAARKTKWARAVTKARELKGYTGFKAIKRGTSFYEKAKELMAEM